MSPPLTSSSVSAFENNVVACFFSLLRDKFRQSLDYKVKVDELEEAVAEWENLVSDVQQPGLLKHILLFFLIFRMVARAPLDNYKSSSAPRKKS